MLRFRIRSILRDTIGGFTIMCARLLALRPESGKYMRTPSTCSAPNSLALK
jgi:hypothetical protein